MDNSIGATIETCKREDNMELTSKERISNILQRKPVDRIGLFEHFWGDTQEKWTEQGHITEKEDLDKHFDFDLRTTWCFNSVADLDFEPVTVEETDETILVRDGNQALLRRHKLHSSTPEHVDFAVRDRDTWNEYIKSKLSVCKERINIDAYKEAKEKAAAQDRFFCWAGVNVFELIHPVCGHEHFLMGMALDPEWIQDMVNTYAQWTIDMMEILFAECGKPDGIWFYEDMGFKSRPFMSAPMYRELVQPGHIKTIDFCHNHDLPVIMHSCGFIEPLLPDMIEAGIDCLQVIEIKAGMDLLKIYHEFGDKISFCGGMDARNLVANDIDAIRKELHEKIPVVKGKNGYILHSDHSIPTTTKYETYRFFVEEGLKLGQY